jgi:hypothetical protein
MILISTLAMFAYSVLTRAIKGGDFGEEMLENIHTYGEEAGSRRYLREYSSDPNQAISEGHPGVG